MLVVGNRRGFGKERFEPHNILITFMGMSMLWVGWFGFNAGSACGANFNAGYAMLATQVEILPDENRMFVFLDILVFLCII